MNKDGDSFGQNFKIELNLEAAGFGSIFKATRNIDIHPLSITQIPRHNINDCDQVSKIDDVTPV